MRRTVPSAAGLVERVRPSIALAPSYVGRPEAPRHSSIATPATAKREPAKKIGGMMVAPVLMAIQARPQIRHINANGRFERVSVRRAA